MVSPGQTVVEVDGLPEMRQALRSLDRSYRKAFDKELRGIGRPIVNEAKQRYRRLHPRRRGGRGSQRGMRSTARRGSAQVVLGSDRYPYLLGQEWGSGRYPQFPERKTDGYFFWPSTVAGADTVYDNIVKLVDRANALNFPGVG